MQPQLPIDNSSRPRPRNLKKAAWLVLLVAVVVAAVLAFLLPSKSVDQGNKSAEHQPATSTGYDHPAQK